MHATLKGTSLLGFALCLVAPGTIAAQEIGDANSITIDPQLDRSDVAGTRSEPALEPRPLRLGSFVLEPSLSVVGGYNSNPLNQGDAEDDAVLTLTPRLRLRSAAPVHLLQVTATGFVRRFASLENENSEEFAIDLRSRFDFNERSNLFATGRRAREIEERSSLTANPLAAEPVSFSQTQGEVGANIAFGALEFQPSAFIAESDYSSLDLTDGSSANQSFRDTRRYGGGLSVEFRFSPLVGVFAAGEYSELDNTNPGGALDRSAEDITLLGGIRGELSPVLSGEIALGYRQRDFDLELFSDFDGLTYRADLQYFTTPLLTLRLQATQNFRNSGIPEVAGVLSNNFVFTAYYDLLRNLRLSARLGYEINDFREVDTEALRPSVRFNGELRLSPNLSVGAYAGVLRQDVSGTLGLQEFTSFSAGLGFTLTP